MVSQPIPVSLYFCITKIACYGFSSSYSPLPPPQKKRACKWKIVLARSSCPFGGSPFVELFFLQKSFLNRDESIYFPAPEEKKGTPETGMKKVASLSRWVFTKNGGEWYYVRSFCQKRASRVSLDMFDNFNPSQTGNSPIGIFKSKLFNKLESASLPSL